MNPGRAWRFARHVPPSQIAARLRIAVQRRLFCILPPSDAPLAQAANAPLAPFPPRPGMATRIATGWNFRFLQRSRNMTESVDWHPRDEGQLWRMNLHYMEYLEALGADDGLALIRSWIATNARPDAKSWHDAWNSYALSIRVVCWMQFLTRHDVRDDAIAASLCFQLRTLARLLETDIGGNHLVKNITALAWGSAWFAGTEADRWRAIAETHLRRALRRQLLADGMHFERSPSYHNQVLADLIAVRTALGAQTRLDATLDRMMAAAIAIAHPDGDPAQFNDAGLTMAYPAKACAAALEHVTGRKVASPAGAFALPEAGLFGLRSERLYVIAKMGAIGPDSLPAHAHGDIGSFELSVDGRRLIVDQGVFEYVDGPLRAASRATANHNCLAIGGASQAEFFGAFRCGARPKVQALGYAASPSGIEAESGHDGYARSHGVVVRRKMMATCDHVEFRDTLSAPAGVASLSGLLLHPECQVMTNDRCAEVRRGETAIAITAQHRWSIEPAVWWPDMGVEQPTTRLRLTLPADCLESVITISLLQKSRNPH